MRRAAKRHSSVVVLVCLVLGAWLIPAGLANATPQEERQGSRLLGELESGALSCSDASASDFELVGEYAMGRMFGSPAQHEAMNRMMTRMMGARGEERVHEAMGRRFSGCGGGQLPAGFGQMMGAANATGMMGGYGYGAGNQGDEDSDGPFGSHMGDWGAGWWVLMAVMMVLFWGLVIFGAVWLIRALMSERHGHGGRSPLEVLDRRLASGEITPEDYRQRREVIQGKEGSSDV